MVFRVAQASETDADVVFTGDTLDPEVRRTALAVEPMTCPPDAFRSGTDVTVLRPGGRWTGVWGIAPR